MAKIRQFLVSSNIAKSVTYSGHNPKTYIVIHETANTSKGANADAHGRLQANGNNRQASWHYTVDDKEIVQSFSDNAQCWHAGNASYNRNSIGIEICVNNDGDYEKAVDNAAFLVKKLMDKHNISAANVIQHNKASGKDCPHFMRSGNKGVTWLQFIGKLSGDEETNTKPSKPTAKPSKPKPKPTKVSGPIADIQRGLNSRYGLNIAVDNIKGPETKKALIIALQTELNKQFNAGLIVDGIWGPKTAAAIVNVRRGAKGNLTWVLQALLVLKGYNIAVDGDFGDATDKAVRSLQRAYKLTVDGIAGKATWTKLM